MEQTNSRRHGRVWWSLFVLTTLPASMQEPWASNKPPPPLPASCYVMGWIFCKVWIRRNGSSPVRPGESQGSWTLVDSPAQRVCLAISRFFFSFGRSSLFPTALLIVVAPSVKFSGS